MTQAELLTQLKTLGLPVAYSNFTSPTEPPFITFIFAYSSDLMADNQNYAEVSNFQVELYTDKKDTTKEAAVQTLLKSLRLPYAKSEAWLDDEKMHQIVYDIQLV